MKFTRVLALLLTVTMLFTGMILPTVAEDGEEEEEYTPIYTIEDLYCIRYDLDGNFKLMNDIDMTADVAEGGDWDIGYGWTPIGEGDSTPFTGTFDGQGYTITGLRITGTKTGYAGLFGYIKNATIKSVTLNGVNIVCGLYIGALAGCAKSCTISGVTVSNAMIVSQGAFTGGILGQLEGSKSIHGNIISCSYDGIISGNGTLSGKNSVGGIVGYMNIYTDVSQCYSSGSVTAAQSAGGIVGRMEGYGDVNDSSASITVNNCYNLSTVSAASNSGGIVGYLYANGSSNSGGKQYSKFVVSHCINFGSVDAEIKAGGIEGYTEIYFSTFGSISTTYNYYLLGTAGKGVYGKNDSATTCVALTAAQSRLKAVYGYLDFENVWFFDKSTGIDHPQLRSNPEPALPPFELVITRLPDSLVCLEGEAPDLTGGQVQCVGLAGDPLLDMTADMICDFDSTHYGVQTVTLYYSGQEVSFTLTVEHNYENIPVPATCLMSGYTMHTCRGCGHQEVTDLTVANGHSFGDWALAGNGFVTRSCANCDEVETEKLSDESVGDINGDGFLSIRDVSLLLMMISG